ncbi:Na+/H+ antiporter NhaA [Zavarzinella formosa]|uniref:Na+/H+ antiporter NhaA n=1 Tax=Zavarzinella formosa TaxID=360055 RepID=UPI0002DD81E2|nr:Na+/H+ antiporter NhaA [Zavarzinella formosa]
MHPSDSPLIPLTISRKLTRPFARFCRVEAAGGGVLLACTLLALALANIPATTEAFHHLWHTPVTLGIGEFALNRPLEFWINDGLMTIFFFVVGLEIKREIVHGELRDPKKAALPILGALGGMLAPAGVYLLLESSGPGQNGWGIPMATDIAFVVGFLALLGKRVPSGLKIFLLSLAIADDIGAVLVIAVFYSTNLSMMWLGLGGAGFALILLMNRIGVRAVPLYAIVGAGVWLCFLNSGVHPTIAGVILGLMTPTSAHIPDDLLTRVVRRVNEDLARPGELHEHHSGTLETLQFAAKEARSPLERLETSLHPSVAFLVMPLFALANAGVTVRPEAVSNTVALAVACGLVFGKPSGIMMFCWLAVKLKVARLPANVTWPVMVGAGSLGGIGFTMSIFVAGLALKGELLDAAKIGTLGGSCVSVILGCLILMATMRRERKG